jgi:hypothetical protein
LVEIKRVSVGTPRDGKAMRMLEEQPVGGRRKTQFPEGGGGNMVFRPTGLYAAP